jgi:hypothetical protein
MSNCYSISSGAAAKGLQSPTTVVDKPAKPYPECPLTAHPARQWCKKIHGKLQYFGPWSDPGGALKKHLGQAAWCQTSALPLADAPGVANAWALGYRQGLQARGLGPATVNRWLAALRALVILARKVGQVC